MHRVLCKLAFRSCMAMVNDAWLGSPQYSHSREILDDNIPIDTQYKLLKHWTSITHQ